MISRGKRKHLVELYRKLTIQRMMIRNLEWQWGMDAYQGRTYTPEALAKLRDSMRKHLTLEKCERLHQLLFPAPHVRDIDSDIFSISVKSNNDPAYLTLQRGKHRRAENADHPGKMLYWDPEALKFPLEEITPEAKPRHDGFDCLDMRAHVQEIATDPERVECVHNTILGACREQVKADAQFTDYMDVLSKQRLEDVPVKRIKIRPPKEEDKPLIDEMFKDLAIIQTFVRGGVRM